jgi:uncharacterized protein
MHCETLRQALGIERIPESESDFSEAARRRLLSVKGEPLFLADWLRPVFVHYEVPVVKLQRDVPFELDLHEGRAYVSLVAFTMRGMRPFRGGRLAAWLFKPIATNDYLNVRTYVRHRGEPGIYFLTEWMNNRFSVRLGPWTFGLPYRFGELNYEHQCENGKLSGAVREQMRGPAFEYKGELMQPTFAPCPAGSLDEFLLERYTAYTSHKSTRRFFRIWHSPWAQQPIRIAVSSTSLLEKIWPWFSGATLAGAHYSPGARDVWMGRPQRV